VVFGPSLTELFWEGGISRRVAAVDRFSTWPPEMAGVPRAGDLLSPSMEVIAALGATSIHVVGSNSSLEALAVQLGIPCYSYSFDTLDDVIASSERLEALYDDADLAGFRGEVTWVLDSLRDELSPGGLRVMAVIHLEEDGAITLAGRNTFFRDIIEGIGCQLCSPDAGSYPSVSVEGVLSMDPDITVILAPGGDAERILEIWAANGLDPSGVSVLTGENVLIPGARLPQTIKEIGSCLN
jgi:iron complex transport system substrate-binding protein